MTDNFKDKVKADVLRMYMDQPYPNYTKQERQNIFPAELCRYRYLGLEPFMHEARYVGIDHSRASLSVADALSSELGMNNVTLREGDVFKLPFEDSSFDIVICQGVLHHTSDPYRGFKELVRICRPGGLVNIYLYNKYNHWRHNLQKARVTRLGGSDLQKRVEVAYRLYGKKPIDQMTPAEIAGFYDQYCHPHKSDHTIGETLAWFGSQRLHYWGAYPPLTLADFIGMAQYRGSLAKQYPSFHTKLARSVVAFSKYLPQMAIRKAPFRRPNLIERFFWQSVYALQGSGGRYSGGPSLCARKHNHN